jgi:hypothetical protein
MQINGAIKKPGKAKNSGTATKKRKGRKGKGQV